MSFVGIVHRKEQDVGVTLQAKVLSPNKLKATTKNYKVTIKGTPTSLYERALQDVTYAKNTLLANLAYDTSDVSATFGTFIPNQGPNGSIITFSVEDGKGFPFTEVFDQTGRFIARPGVGDVTSEGNIRFVATITENGVTESVETSLKVSCDPMVPDVFYEVFGEEQIWNIVKGSNVTKNNITSSLNIGTNGVRILDGSDPEDRALLGAASIGRNAKLKLQFTLVDDMQTGASQALKSALGNGWATSRFDGGSIRAATQQTYTNAYAAYKDATDEDKLSYIELYNTPGDGCTYYYIRYKGASIQCTASFVDSNDDPITSIQSRNYVVSGVATLSKVLTNTEVMDAIISDSSHPLHLVSYSTISGKTSASDEFTFRDSGTGQRNLYLLDYAESTDANGVFFSVYYDNSGNNVNLTSTFGDIPITFNVTTTPNKIALKKGTSAAGTDYTATEFNERFGDSTTDEINHKYSVQIKPAKFAQLYDDDIEGGSSTESAGEIIRFSILLTVSAYGSSGAGVPSKEYYTMVRVVKENSPSNEPAGE